MLVAAVTVDLAANFAAGPSSAVNIDVSGSRANGLNQFIKFAGADSSLIRQVGDIYSSERPGDRGWRCRARLSAGGTVT